MVPMQNLPRHFQRLIENSRDWYSEFYWANGRLYGYRDRSTRDYILHEWISVATDTTYLQIWLQERSECDSRQDPFGTCPLIDLANEWLEKAENDYLTDKLLRLIGVDLDKLADIANGIVDCDKCQFFDLPESRYLLVTVAWEGAIERDETFTSESAAEQFVEHTRKEAGLTEENLVDTWPVEVAEAD